MMMMMIIINTSTETKKYKNHVTITEFLITQWLDQIVNVLQKSVCMCI